MKNIVLNYAGKEYTLEFTRKTVEIMARQGFKVTDVVEQPVLGVPTLFQGAFLSKHPNLRKGIVDDIYEHVPHRSELINALAEMYNIPTLALLEDIEENEGNATWTVQEK